MLDIQDFIAPVVPIVKKESEKAMDVKSKREDRRCKSVNTFNSTKAWSGAPSDLPLFNTSEEQTNKKAYFVIFREPVHVHLPWSKESSGSKAKRYIPILERAKDVPSLEVIEIVHTYITNVPYYRN